jgi:formylglycine-generating enzyme
LGGSNDQVPQIPIDPMIGRVLGGRYRIERLLGAGGFGSAYLAIDGNFAPATAAVRRVVVKIPHAERTTTGTDGLPKDFAKEAGALTRLSHAHIVKVLDVGEEPDTPFLVLDYAAGGTLDDRLRSGGGRQSVEEVLGWLPDVARALDYIHAQDVLHRDVKPSNILFDHGGSALLADFGIVKVFGSTSKTGSLPGSPLYMGPEAMLQPLLDGRYDQYALAVTVYEALSGHYPIEPEEWRDGESERGVSPITAQRLLYRKTTEAPAALRVHAPQVPAPVAAAVDRALSKDREARFSSCVAFARAVDEATRHVESVPPPRTPPRPPVPSARASSRPATRPRDAMPDARPVERAIDSPIERPTARRTGRFGAVAVGLLALIGGGAFLLFGRGGTPSNERAVDARPATATLLVVESPLEDAIVTEEEIRVTGQASGPSNAVLAVDGKPVEWIGGRFSTILEPRADGRRAVEVTFGPPSEPRQRVERRSIVVDTTKPTLTITKPVDRSVAFDATTVTIEGRIDDANPEAVMLGTQKIPLETNDSSFVLDDVALSEGASPTIRLRAVDRGGLLADEVLIELTRRPKSRSGEPSSSATPPSSKPSWAKTSALQDEYATAHGLAVAFENSIGMRFVLVPPGKFTMGSPESEQGRGSDETQHEVELTRPYYVSIWETTNGQYRRFKKDHRSGEKLDREEQPVVEVSHDDATAFVGWLSGQEAGKNYRLPTEAEWEFACRAGTTTPFSFGTTIDSSEANYDGRRPYAGGATSEFRDETVAVGTLPANAWGLYEMHGNAWEWCADWYSDYPAGSAKDPTGPPNGSALVLRGGSWEYFPRVIRSASRGRAEPGGTHYPYGFRVAVSVALK